MKKTVRIAVAMMPSGEWNSTGASTFDDAEAMGYAVDPLPSGESRFWVEAEIEIPEPIKGTVTPA